MSAFPIVVAVGNQIIANLLTQGPWRPPQWGQAASFTLTATDPTTGNQTAYVFDGILRADHEERATVTMNPVQTGAAISDHIYINPPTLVVEIQMSDSMQSFTIGQWASAPSRSVSCYQTLIALEEAKNLVSIATPLRTYMNMSITSVRAEETKDTKYAGNFKVSFQKLLLASVQTTNSSSAASANGAPTVSANPQATNQTLQGETQSTPVPSSITTQNNLQSSPAITQSVSTVPAPAAAGSWSSTNINSIPGALSAG